MEGGVLTRTCFLAGRLSGRTVRISQDSAKAYARGLVTKTYSLAGRAARISQDSAKACARGLVTNTYSLAGRAARISQDGAKACARGLVTNTYSLAGRAARISQDGAKACARGLVTNTYSLAGRAARISQDSAKACARGAVRAATWTTQRVVSSARLLNPFNWRTRKLRGLQRETEIRVSERRRIGQDLHDGVGQTLSGVAFMSRALERKLAAKLGPGDDGAADAAQIAEIAEEAISQTRSMARVLNRAELSAGGLMLALGEMVSDFEKVFGVPCTFEHDDRVLIDDDAVATHLYRIAQEAATNAIRHGGAKHVAVGLAPASAAKVGSQEDERVTLTVQDDGTGFSLGETVGDGPAANSGGSSRQERPGPPGAAKGMGLRIMDHRAKAIGGSLSIRRRPEGGTVLTCEFPLSGP